MKTRLYFSIFFILFSATRYFDANAQGCVAVRKMVGVSPLSIRGYTLLKGEFQIGTGYLYLHSFRHLVGTEEQLEHQTR